MKKILVVGLIIILISVGVQPAFAERNNSTIVNNKSKEDCGCETVNSIHLDKLDRIGILLDRLEGYTKFLMLLSRSNPVIYGECLELSDGVNTISDYYEDLITVASSNDYTFICGILENFFNSIYALIDILFDIISFLDSFSYFGRFLKASFSVFWVFLEMMGVFVNVVGYSIDCW